MFKNFLGEKEKPRVFIGTLSVPKEDFDSQNNISVEFHNILEEIFTLPHTSEILEPLKTDLGLDVYVAKFQEGGIESLHLSTYSVGFFWRPKVSVKARLFNLKTQKTKHTFSSTEVISGWRFVNGVMSIKSMLGFRAFSKSDMNELLYRACNNILIQIQKKL